MGKLINNKLWIILNIILIVLILIISNDIRFWDQDEAAYVGFAYNMLHNHTSFAIPAFDWSFPHRKPPLLIWMLTGIYKVIGINEFNTRLCSFIFSLLTLRILFKHIKSSFEESLAYRTIIILSASLIFIIYSKTVFTDIVLLFFETLCFIVVLEILNKKPKTIHSYFFWLALAAGVLLKGPSILIPLGVFAIAIFFTYFNDLKRIFGEIKFFPGIIISILLISLWVYQTYTEDNGAFIKWIIDWYVLNRVNSGVWGQTGPPGYYLLLYSLSLFPVLICSVRSFKLNNVLNYKPYLIAALSSWIIFEILVSKLPSYAIGFLPFIALAIAKLSSEYLSRLSFILINCFYLIIAILAFYFQQIMNIDLLKIGYISIFIVLVFIISFFFFKRIRFYQFTFLNFIFLLAIIIFPFRDFAASTQGTKEIANYIKSVVPQNTPIYLNDITGKPPSLPLYLRLNGFNQIFTEAIPQKGSIVICKELEAKTNKYTFVKKIEHRFTDRNVVHEYFIYSVD